MKESGVEVGNKIDYSSIGERSFDIEEIHNFLKPMSNSGFNSITASWGYNKPVIVVKNMVFRFTVQGHHHKGHVYIVLGFMDTFNIYFTSNRGTIKTIKKDVYIDELINTIDVVVERIKEYS